jgi:hypothetical protein
MCGLQGIDVFRSRVFVLRLEVYTRRKKMQIGGYSMTTTGELRAIVEELELEDIGDAAAYLGEETAGAEEISHEHVSLAFLPPYEHSTDDNYSPH